MKKIGITVICLTIGMMFSAFGGPTMAQCKDAQAKCPGHNGMRCQKARSLCKSQYNMVIQ